MVLPADRAGAPARKCALLGRRLGDAQHRADVAAVDSLPIAQHQHFAVLPRQPGGPPAAGRATSSRRTAALGLRRGAGADRPVLRPRRPAGPATPRFPRHAARPTGRDGGAGRPTDPRPAGAATGRTVRPGADVAVQTPVGLGQNVLHHVGRVDARGEPGVDAQGDDPPQPPPVAVQQRSSRVLSPAPVRSSSSSVSGGTVGTAIPPQIHPAGFPETGQKKGGEDDRIVPRVGGMLPPGG